MEGDRVAAGLRVTVSGSAEIVRTALWDDVSVGDDARLVECIVCDGVQVPAGARYERSAIVRADGRVPAAGERIEGNLLLRSI